MIALKDDGNLDTSSFVSNGVGRCRFRARFGGVVNASPCCAGAFSDVRPGQAFGLDLRFAAARMRACSTRAVTMSAIRS